jgi:hypothetical protein
VGEENEFRKTVKTEIPVEVLINNLSSISNSYIANNRGKYE